MRYSVVACVAWLYPICAVVGIYPPNGQIPLMPVAEWSADRLVKVLHPTEEHRQLLPKLEVNPCALPAICVSFSCLCLVCRFGHLEIYARAFNYPPCLVR